jgi:3',5'-cyclic AMP phosphodiesterase CpdA
MKTMADCKVDLLLAGHFHIADTSQTAKRYNMPGYSAIIVSAGTSTSTRGRGQPNSLNVIQIDRPHLIIERRTWRPGSRLFDVLSVELFRKTSEGWIRE